MPGRSGTRSSLQAQSGDGCLPHARLRQRNAYFSSSDAAFADRYAASAEWERVKSAEIGVESGWRIYSSGPGIFISLLLRQVLGHRRLWGKPVVQPLLPAALKDMALDIRRKQASPPPLTY